MNPLASFRRYCRRHGLGVLHLYVAVVFAVLFFPLVVLVLFSFVKSGDMRFPITGLSLRWYREILSDSTVLGGILASLQVAFFTGLVVTCIGTPAVVLLSRHRFGAPGS